MTMDGTLMSYNSAAYGGALSVEDGSVVSCTGTTSTSDGFLNNTAAYYGAAIFVYPGDATIESDTCDFGTSAGGDSNSTTYYSGNDIGHFYSGNDYSYGDDESFSCSGGSCY
ncbi:MAG: hypothetical protein ACI8RZ_003360 [Myxococcota bacterium]